MTAQPIQLLPEPDANWSARAECRKHDPELMFPELEDRLGKDRAKKVCRACPVVSQCLERALAEQEGYGVWGGLTERERAAINRRRH